MSAFTIAFQVPNLVRSLFADAAIQAAFVPVFTEQLEKGNRREAFRLASSMIFLVTLILGALTALFILLAPVLMPLFVPEEFVEVTDLTVAPLEASCSRSSLLLGVTGMVVGILNSYDRFGAYAISPFFWNVAIISVLVALAPAFPEEDEIYAYAIGVLVGTVVQLLIPVWDLRNTPYGLRRALIAPFRFGRGDWRDSNVRRVLVLMLPVTICLGLININLLINSTVGFLVSDQAPRRSTRRSASTCSRRGSSRSRSRPSSSRRWRGSRPAPTSTACARRWRTGCARSCSCSSPRPPRSWCSREPMTRLVYERGVFDATSTDLVSEALFWFAFSLPFNGLFLLLTRTFFSLQRPWLPTAISAGNLVITAGVALLLYEPYGIGGIVAATGLATIVSVIAEAWRPARRARPPRARPADLVRRADRARGGGPRRRVVLRLGRPRRRAGPRGGGQIVSLGVALAAGALAYLAAVLALRVPEAAQVLRLVASAGSRAGVDCKQTCVTPVTHLRNFRR